MATPKGSTAKALYQSVLESAFGILIKADVQHNYTKDGSTPEKPKFTREGLALKSRMESAVADVANAIGDALAGEETSSIGGSTGVSLYDSGSGQTLRIPFGTMAALVAADAVQNASKNGLVTSTNIWSMLGSGTGTDFQLNPLYLKNALEGYLTADSMQGMFRKEGSDAYVSKIFDDEVLGLITFIAGLRTKGMAYLMKGFQIGLYQPGITGYGAKVDENGNGEFESLIVRRFLEVPELRYNRTDVLAGDSWRAPGGGIIESVVVDDDGATGTVTLKLEEGEVGTIAVDDICMGVFHDFNNPGVNETETTDDGFGNRTFAGFCTVYFRITSVTDITEVDGITYYKKVFTYALRPTSSRWTKRIHPQAFMNFVCYGNFTRTDRQNSTYMTPAYTRMLRGQNDWEYDFSNIGMQFGDLSILANFDTTDNPNPRAREASEFLFYIDGDIMHTGVLRQVDSHGRDIIDYYDQGEWSADTEYFYKDRVTHNGAMWLLVKEDIVDPDGTVHGLIGDEPASDNPNWLAVVYAESLQSMGHWEAEKTPYSPQRIVSLGGTLYLSRTTTSNPPVGLLKGRDDNGNEIYLKDKNGNYIIADPEKVMTDDWGLLLDIQDSLRGDDAIFINLTNDSDSIITDINGVIPAGTEYPTTKAQLFKGSLQITSGITWSVSAVGCSATIAPESGTVVTSNMTDDKAYVTIKAAYNNYQYTKVFSIGKLYGADKYILEPSDDVVKFDPNTNTFSPTQLTVRAYCIKNGERKEVTSTAGLGYIEYNGSQYYSGMTINITSASQFVNGKLTFRLYDAQDTPQLGDMEEVPLVQDGVNGTGSVYINLTNDTDVICTDSDGNIAEGEVYPMTTAQLFYQLAQVSNTEISWNCAGDGCSATIDEDGVVTTSNMTANVAKVLVTGAYQGHSYYKTFTFRKVFGVEKYYLSASHDVIIRDQNGSYTPSSIVVRAYLKRLGEEPVECTSALGLAKIVYAGQLQPQYSPVSVVIENTSFTNRHLVFTLVDNDSNILDTEDIPLVMDGKDGIDGVDGKDWNYQGNWQSGVEYAKGQIVRLGDTLYMATATNTNQPPMACLKDGVDGKYLTDENGMHIIIGDVIDDRYWIYYFRDGRDGIDGTDGQDGRDGQDGETAVYINLTNDSDSVITDMEGNPLEDLPTTTAQFFYGSKQLTKDDGVVWGTEHVVGCKIEFDQDGNYTVKEMSSDRAQVTIKAIYNGIYYLKNFNFVKLYGQDKYVLETSYGTVQYHPLTDSYTPSTLTLYGYVIKNGDITVVRKNAGVGYIKVGSSSTKYYDGDTINVKDFFGSGGVEVRLYNEDDESKDMEYIPRVTDGKDGDNAVIALFDDENVNFICNSSGSAVSGQSYSSTGSLYLGLEKLALDRTATKVTCDKVNFSPTFSSDGKDLIITMTGFKSGALAVNKMTVRMVAADGSCERSVVLKVNKIVPGADGKSPVVYNVVPSINILRRSDSQISPSVMTASVRKSYSDNGTIKNDMLTPSGASALGVLVYYKFDAVITNVSSATRLASGNVTIPSSTESFVYFAIADTSGNIIDTQSVAIVSDGVDGTSIVSLGHWDSETEYAVGNLVTFMNSMWRCLVGNTGIPPIGLMKGNHNGTEYFLKNNEGGYIAAIPLRANSSYWTEDLKVEDTVYLDMDNENDSILYNERGEKLSGNVTSKAILYVNGVAVSTSFSISIKTVGCTASVSGTTVTITDISSANGSVEVSCSYNGGVYYAVINVTRIVNSDKFDIVVLPNAVTYDTTTGDIANKDIKAEVWRTNAKDGTRTNISSISDFGLSLNVYGRQSGGNEVQLSWTTAYSGGHAALTVSDSNVESYEAITVRLTKGSETLDVESLPINKYASNKRFYLVLTPESATKTATGQWVSFSSVIVKVYKVLGAKRAVPAVTSEVGLFYSVNGGTASSRLALTNGQATVSVTNFPPATTNSIRFFLTEDQATDTEIDSKSITIVENGQQGYAGCQVRSTKWVNVTDSSAYRLTPLNDRGTNEAFGVVDVIAVPYTLGDIDGNGTTAAPSTGYYWYAYKGANRTGASNNRKIEMTWADERTYHYYDWEEIGQQKAMFISLLIAEYGRIEFGTTNEFLIENNLGNVRAGISGVGATATSTSDGGIRFWAGSSVSSSAPFRVYDSGKFYASKADIAGKVVASDGKIANWEINEGSIVSKEGNIILDAENEFIQIGTEADSRILISATDKAIYIGDSIVLDGDKGKIKIGTGVVFNKDGSATIGKMSVDKLGNIVVSYGEFTGKITANSGKIGGFYIDDNGIYNITSGQETYTDKDFVSIHSGLGSSTIIRGTEFTPDGYLIAHYNAEFNGTDGIMVKRGIYFTEWEGENYINTGLGMCIHQFKTGLGLVDSVNQYSCVSVSSTNGRIAIGAEPGDNDWLTENSIVYMASMRSILGADKWMINSDGTALLRNVNINGPLIVTEISMVNAIANSVTISKNAYTCTGNENTIIMNPSSNYIELYLPSKPIHGQTIRIMCIKSSAEVDVYVASGSSHKITGLGSVSANDVSITTPYQWYTATYVSGTWYIS